MQNVIVNCDTPFLPADLVARLFQYIENHQVAYAFDGERVNPTFTSYK